MSNLLYRLGRSAATRPWAAIGAWVVLALVVIGSSVAFGRDLEESFEAPGLDSYQAAQLLAEAQADEGGITAHVVLGAQDAAAQLAPVEAALEALPRVLSTTSDVSPDGAIALVRVQYPAIEHLDASDLDNLKDAVADLRDESSLTLETGGDLFFAFEEAPTGLGEVAGLVVAMIVLLIAFGSFVAMGLPIGMALFGLVIGATSMKLVTYLIDIPAWAPQLAAMVGLGVGIDYALFLVTRHREHLALGMPVAEAAGRALATAGQAVIFAGGTVVVAILGLLFAGIPFVTGGGVAISAMVLVMVLASVTLLPALLGLAGHRINGRRRTPHRPSTGWYRWGAHVTRNATAYLVGGAVLMIALAAPVFALNLGFPDDGTKPESRTERRAYDLIADGFGPGANGPLVIAVDISRDGVRRGAVGRRDGSRRGNHLGRRPRPSISAQAWRPWWRSRPRRPRTLPPRRPSRGSAARSSRRCSTAPRRPPMSAVRLPPSPTSVTGSRSGCRASWWPCCCCRSSCSRCCSGRYWCR